MRDIKFRAWDGSSMYYEGQFQFDQFDGIPFTKDNIGFYPMDGIEIGEMISGNIDQTNVVIMRFTGLSDKSGKEIYESDVIEAWIIGTLDERPHIEQLTVVFKQGSFCAENERRSMLLSKVCKRQPLNKYQECFLTGNIYETIPLNRS